MTVGLRFAAYRPAGGSFRYKKFPSGPWARRGCVFPENCHSKIYTVQLRRPKLDTSLYTSWYRSMILPRTPVSSATA